MTPSDIYARADRTVRLWYVHDAHAAREVLEALGLEVAA